MEDYFVVVFASRVTCDLDTFNKTLISEVIIYCDIWPEEPSSCEHIIAFRLHFFAASSFFFGPIKKHTKPF